jgi:toxin YoeB
LILIFSSRAWDEYLEYQSGEPQLLERLNGLIRECTRHPFKGTGKPEPLKDNMRGWWSRRIDREHRLVYRVSGAGQAQALEISQCRYHY